MKKLNCWEVQKCGREPGGHAVADQGPCPAAVETHPRRRARRAELRPDLLGSRRDLLFGAGGGDRSQEAGQLLGVHVLSARPERGGRNVVPTLSLVRRLNCAGSWTERHLPKGPGCALREGATLPAGMFRVGAGLHSACPPCTRAFFTAWPATVFRGLGRTHCRPALTVQVDNSCAAPGILPPGDHDERDDGACSGAAQGRGRVPLGRGDRPEARHLPERGLEARPGTEGGGVRDRLLPEEGLRPACRRQTCRSPPR